MPWSGLPSVAVLAFRLHGPMAAWGTVEAAVERKPSSRDPGRGAILGLLAAALGIRRGDDDAHAALSKGVRLAVCGHGPRRLVQDYRTVQTVEPLRNEDFQTRAHALSRARNIHTLTGWRQHVEDGLWRVFVASTGQDLSVIEEALKRPAFLLCLGRREYPLALPPDPRLTPENLPGALAGYAPTPDLHWDKSGGLDVARFLRDRLHLDADGDLWWDPGFPGAPEGHGRIVIDQPASRTGWRFRSRETRWAAASAVTAPKRGNSAASFFAAAKEGM